jgi:anionic cell wall polymer biosynthesis LytR-Cps2A-Psr (LCP) family protein
MGKAIAGKLLYGVICLGAAVLMVVAGYAHKVVGQTTELGQGIAISGSSSNSPSVGAMNILVMGLESRTNYMGQTLPNSLLTAMHAGSASAVAAGQLGSQDTNTLILIHIFAGGQKAVGFSIPRDDLVTYPHTYDGQTEGKIDGAYAYAYTQYVSENQGKESNSALYLHANRAGQTATLDTVQSVTGQHIDHFVEVNLAGFYYLASAFGGIEVCIAPAPASVEPSGLRSGTNLTDSDPLTGTDNSGFNAYLDGYHKKTGGPQYLHLAAAQALAFVRSRDTLPGIDLGRTKRQQATIDYVIFQLKHEGAFTAVGKLNSLLSTAGQYLITDSTFNLLDFASDMGALSGQNLSFQTLPYTPENGVFVPGYPGAQDVNIINVPAIKRLVSDAFNPPPAVTDPGGAVTETGPTVGGTASPGATSSTGTASPGTADTPGTASPGTAGAGTSPGTAGTANQGAQASGAQVVGGEATASPAATPSPSATSTGSSGVGSSGTGGTVTVAPNAPYGIPCVY